MERRKPLDVEKYIQGLPAPTWLKFCQLCSLLTHWEEVSFGSLEMEAFQKELLGYV